MSNTLVLQSHRQPLPHSWLSLCIESVRRWCKLQHFSYHWMGDEVFDNLSPELRHKTRDQPVVATDLARLLALQKYLESEYECVIWCDADTLVFNPRQLEVSDRPYELGREIWVQPFKDSKRLKVYVKVHNAFMMFRQDNVFLDFYADSCVRLLEQHPGPYVSQFIGPKFLSAIHNLIACPVNEAAGVLSPWVIKDLLKGGGDFSEAFKQRCEMPPAALNLCASSVINGDVSDNDMIDVCQLLLRQENI